MGRKKLSFALFFLTLSSVSLLGFKSRGEGGGPLPPLGERLYLVPEKRSYRPVVISKMGTDEPQHAMRDPMQPGHVSSPQPHIRPKPQPAPKPVAKAGQLHFRKMPVSGRLTEPRVEFTRETLPVGRADEPVGEDFYPRVFAPAQDETF